MLTIPYRSAYFQGCKTGSKNHNSRRETVDDTFAEKAKMWDSNPQIVALADLFSAELDKVVPDHKGVYRPL